MFGTKTGRIHMQKQDFDSLQLRKIKGLKRNLKKEKENESIKRKKVDIQ